MPILQKNKKSHLEKNMFLDEPVDVARYDQLKYPQIDTSKCHYDFIFYAYDNIFNKN